MCKLKLLRDVLRCFHASPATNKHYVERSGCNPNNEYKSKYELEIKQIEAHRRQKFVPEVRAHHQGVPTSPLRSPQRTGSLSTLILSQIDHKGLEMGCSLTLLNEQVIQTSRRSHTNRDLPRVTPSHLGAKAPRVTSESRT